jgi:hypothetical protein
MMVLKKPPGAVYSPTHTPNTEPLPVTVVLPKKRGRKKRVAAGTEADKAMAGEGDVGADVANQQQQLEQQRMEQERLGLTPDWIVHTVCYHIFGLQVCWCSDGAVLQSGPDCNEQYCGHPCLTPICLIRPTCPTNRRYKLCEAWRGYSRTQHTKEHNTQLSASSLLLSACSALAPAPPSFEVCWTLPPTASWRPTSLQRRCMMQQTTAWT